MSEQKTESQAGKITPYKKCIVIENGSIKRMFWEHPAGNEDFDHDAVITRWVELHRDDEGKCPDFTDQKFLSDHGFYKQNVIRDGVRIPA